MGAAATSDPPKTAVALTRPAFEVLEREAKRDMENAIQERVSFSGEAEGERQERTLLACADTLGALGRAKGPFVLDRNSVTVEVVFSDEALIWMNHALDGTQQHVEELDTSGEGDLAYCAGEVYLAHVLRRVVAAQGGLA